MRMSIEIDEKLLRESMRSCRGRTKRATVEAALRLLIQTKSQSKMRRWRGKVDWWGDLERSR
jgi:Arc/MetJ family transcription regulator